MDFVILSNQRFDYPLKTNKWHIAIELAKLGHRVVFVDPPIRIRKAVKLLLMRRIGPIDLIRGYREVNSNLRVFMPLTISPTEKPNLVTFNIRRLSRFLDLIEMSDIILWVYHQVMDAYIDKIPHSLLIYDCVDEYSKFPNFAERGLSDYVSKKEEHIAKKADIVFATTESLVRKMRRFNSNVHFTPNVGDYGRFKNVRMGVIKRAKELEPIEKPIIGFTGAIDSYKLNLGLVYKCAKSYPNFSFVLIGPVGVSESTNMSKLEELKKLKNVHFLGERPYDVMPNFFEGFDAFIIPYNLNEYVLGGCFPVKFHDALSAGLPVIVTDVPSYKPFEDVCYIAKDEEDFVKLIDRALQEDGRKKVEDRKKVAKKNSWEGKVKNQLKIMRSYSRKSSL